MIAVISSGDHEGPQPPLKQAVWDGRSKTSTTTESFVMWIQPLSYVDGSAGADAYAHAATPAETIDDCVAVCTRIHSTVDGDDSPGRADPS